MKKNVVVGLLGPVLDQGQHSERWNKWRPSVSICQHEEFLISKYYLLYQHKFSKLAQKVLEDIKSVSPETEVILSAVSMENPWDFEIVYNELLSFSEQLVFIPENEEYFIHITTGTHVAQICLFLLTESRYLPGKLLQTSPPKRNNRNQNTDITGTYSIINLDLAKYDSLAMRYKQKQIDDISFLKSGIQTRNNSFNTLIERIETVAIRSSDPILITGPTGAGKSQLAKRIYELKKAHNQIIGKFLDINCATIKGDNAMSTLFGHKKGSFTGAVSDRMGLLKAADNGICFLDEIAELGIDEQAMLLRAVEEKRFLPLGADTEVKSNFQLICGTNKNLKQKVKEGYFREDLLARINLWTFQIPGLSERKEDIEPNIEYELTKQSENSGRKVSFNAEAKNKFLRFATSNDSTWKSNFRDLNGAIRRMTTLARGGRITENEVDEEINRLLGQWRDDDQNYENYLNALIPEEKQINMDLFELISLQGIIQVCRKSNSLSDAGRKLYNVSRYKKQNQNDADRLSKYLKKYNIQWKDLMQL